jgi:hypothetical protein
MRLIRGLPDRRLMQRIIRFHRMGTVSERGLGFYLLDFNRRGLFRRHGFSSTVQFALMKLHLPTRKTRELIRVARALEGLSLMDRAFSKGKISWSAVRELTRVAVKETEGEWLSLAEGSSLRKIEQTVSRAAHGERPPKDPYSLSKTRYRVEARLSAEDYAVVQTAWARLRETAGEELDAASAMVLLAQRFLEQPLELQEKDCRKAYQVVYHRCSQCARAWVESSDGPEGISQSKVAKREKEAEVVHIEEAGDPRKSAKRAPADPRGSAMRAHCDPDDSAPDAPAVPARPPVSLAARDIPNTPMIRQQVLSRDGAVCAAPGCSNRGTLFAHHVVFRSLGGRTTIENEVCFCQSCHSLVHDGQLTVEGEAPHGLRWNDSEGRAIETRLTADDSGSRYTVESGRNDPRGSCEPHVSCEPRELCDPRGSYEPRELCDPRGSCEAHGLREPHGPIDEEEDTTLYSLDEVPAEVDSAWWQKYGHNFEFKGMRAMLKKAR